MVLTWHEERRGVRVLADRRSAFDTKMTRIQFVLNHVDFNAFARDEAKRLGVKTGHFVVYLALKLVRGVERVLTRVVRKLRVHHEVESKATGGENTREFVKTLSDFKGRLKDTVPETSEVN